MFRCFGWGIFQLSDTGLTVLLNNFSNDHCVAPQRQCDVPFYVWCVRSVYVKGDSVTVMMNIDRHCAIPHNFFRPKLGEIFNEHWGENKFEQDSATTHTSRRSLGVLWETLPGHVFLRGDIPAAALPDLTFCLGLPQSQGITISSSSFESVLMRRYSTKLLPFRQKRLATS